MAKYVYGIKSVKFGTPTGSATMPVTLTAWAQTVEGSFTLSESEATSKEFKVEETATPVKSIVSEYGSLSGTWRAYDLTPSLIETVKGGDGHTDAKKFEAPGSPTTIELALEIETTDGAKFNIYKAAIIARLDGAITRGDILQMEVKATALDPGSAASPWSIVFP